ncbi:MAG TPA: cation:proton antiporter [Candidatus Saccharimonadales bacterium]|nr:cation:proton antiporter [Candidatus Saccharimonadales bacterium]
MHLIKLVLFILLGFAIAQITGIHNLENAHWYVLVVAALLAIGLYASTYGIDLKEARKHLKIIVSAVTVGVVLKAAIVGGSLALLFQDPFFLILGITVAQIDPLSVAGLMKGSRMSAKAKTILASWASFDDPITVILALYAPLLVAQLTGVDLGSITGNPDTSSNVVAYVRELGLNLLLAGGALVLWLVIRYYTKKAYAWLAPRLAVSVYLLLAAVFSISVLYFMMLGIALVGLFLRPPKLDMIIDHTITWALRAAAVLLGLLLIGGVDIWKGIALGVAAYFAQVIVGFLLTRGLPTKDRWHISFAQQNGITAIILALLFEPIHPGTVAIVAPAIIVINGLHWLMNKFVDNKLLRA